MDRLMSTPMDRLCTQKQDADTYIMMNVGFCCACRKPTNLARYVSTIEQDLKRPAPYSDILYFKGDRIFQYRCEHH